MEPANGNRPLLIYDGGCGFCAYWAHYWQKLTGGRVDYAPYQEVAARYPQIPPEAFARAIQYVAPDGKTASAAEASFLTLSHAPGKAFWLALYRKMPGFAALSEWVYAFIAAHRPAFYLISRLLWGKDYEPPRYDLVAWLFLRGIALIYLAAFASFGVQAMGLIGSQGILPLQDYLDAVRSDRGTDGYWSMPMVFWLGSSDFTIKAVCWAGVASSLLLICNILPRTNLLLLYVLYLSLLYAGQEFMNYQWDIFILEAGFLSLVMCFAQTHGIWLLRWLIFRFMFMSGVVKLASGDRNWANLSALSYHFFTQPLPTPLAWYAAQIPAHILLYMTGAVFVVELVLPFLLFFPRRLRFVFAFGTLLLELCIFLTGNYNFFNLQTMLLCLPLFDDAAVRKVLPKRLKQLRLEEHKYSRISGFLATPLALIIVFNSFTQMEMRLGHRPANFAKELNKKLDPLHIVNIYGLFAVMTTERREIVIEGSDDGKTWKEYAFRYKPGDVRRAPLWNIPHQPRLDWQMWFAALGPPRYSPWFAHFVFRILQNSPPVMALMKKNPFPDRPPHYGRAMFYDYTFATPEEKRNGIWWHREPLGFYVPPVSLSGY